MAEVIAERLNTGSEALPTGNFTYRDFLDMARVLGFERYVQVAVDAWSVFEASHNPAILSTLRYTLDEFEPGRFAAARDNMFAILRAFANENLQASHQDINIEPSPEPDRLVDPAPIDPIVMRAATVALSSVGILFDRADDIRITPEAYRPYAKEDGALASEVDTEPPVALSPNVAPTETPNPEAFERLRLLLKPNTLWVLDMVLRYMTEPNDEAIVEEFAPYGMNERKLGFLKSLIDALNIGANDTDTIQTLKRLARLPRGYGTAVRQPHRIVDEPAEDEMDVIDDAESDDDSPQATLSGVHLTADAMADYMRKIAKTRLLSAEEEVELTTKIEVGVFALERLEKADEYIDPEEKILLQILAQEGRDAQDRMIIANMRLVISIAKKHIGLSDLSLIDLVQEGSLGLLRAVQKFDNKKGYKFSTYATAWIKQFMVRAREDTGRQIRLPVHVQEKLSVITRAQEALRSSLSCEPTIEEIAAYTDMPVTKVEKYLGYARQTARPASLAQPLSEADGGTLADIILDSDAPDPVEVIAGDSLISDIERALETLDHKDREILGLHFGLRSAPITSIEALADALDVTRNTARLRRAKALSKLRHPSRSHLLRHHVQ